MWRTGAQHLKVLFACATHVTVIRDIHNLIYFPKGMRTDMSGLLLGISPANMSKVWAHNSPLSSSNTHNTKNSEGNSKNDEGNNKNNDRKLRVTLGIIMIIAI